LWQEEGEVGEELKVEDYRENLCPVVEEDSSGEAVRL
jgi:hypothetical protein